MDIKPTFGSTYNSAKLQHKEPVSEAVKPAKDEQPPQKRRQSFQRSHYNALKIGIFALGGEEQIDAWATQGLEIRQETILAAYEIFNEATRLDMNNPDSNGITFNRHQIVINRQEVPAWFFEEYREALGNIRVSSIQEDFIQGRVYYINKSKMVKPHFLQSSLYNQSR